MYSILYFWDTRSQYVHSYSVIKIDLASIRKCHLENIAEQKSLHKPANIIAMACSSFRLEFDVIILYMHIKHR